MSDTTNPQTVICPACNGTGRVPAPALSGTECECFSYGAVLFTYNCSIHGEAEPPTHSSQAGDSELERAPLCTCPANTNEIPSTHRNDCAVSLWLKSFSKTSDFQKLLTVYGLACNDYCMDTKSDDATELERAKAAVLDAHARLLLAAEQRGQRRELEQTICHKHGPGTSCPQIRDRLAALDKVNKGEAER